MDPSVKLVKDDGYSKKVDPSIYGIGSLLVLHVAKATRPGIVHAVGKVSKFSAAPTQAHRTAVKRIFRYLKGATDLKLQYKPVNEILLGYSDADWLNDRHSTTGNVFTMSGGAVSWLSQNKQQSPDLLLKQNTLLWVLLLKKPYG